MNDLPAQPQCCLPSSLQKSVMPWKSISSITTDHHEVAQDDFHQAKSMMQIFAEKNCELEVKIKQLERRSSLGGTIDIEEDFVQAKSMMQAYAAKNCDLELKIKQLERERDELLKQNSFLNERDENMNSLKLRVNSLEDVLSFQSMEVNHCSLLDMTDPPQSPTKSPFEPKSPFGSPRMSMARYQNKVEDSLRDMYKEQMKREKEVMEKQFGNEREKWREEKKDMLKEIAALKERVKSLEKTEEGPENHVW
ncbi:filamin A interacting protein 1-like [Planoprotostelium fungivorum]|uniref:Filamin A interacting protein 1-like n=1 Tax=Planoprotostelium fungivorum TaxID=1890364 RepID=A0A2P6NC68_9EUKA|nr:filamin A interacting protein 1-like [Planoprotostelium fungivorum]